MRFIPRWRPHRFHARATCGRPCGSTRTSGAMSTSAFACGLPEARADRQGDVGDAGPHGGDDPPQVRAPAGRREHRVGSLADRGDAACFALSPDQCERGAGRAESSRSRLARRRLDTALARGTALLERGRDRGRAQQQRAKHPGLRRALDRRRRRMLHGAGRLRRRPLGGPGDAAHLEPARRELAASRRSA